MLRIVRTQPSWRLGRQFLNANINYLGISNAVGLYCISGGNVLGTNKSGQADIFIAIVQRQLLLTGDFHVTVVEDTGHSDC
ncbi:MAG: hypothetical protein CM15mP60_1480 [Alphaproteobacteria bacterium]|nr:MAG: hypothetical protein CM15mP60_1480 [Alphaproteobacteria bacterium]